MVGNTRWRVWITEAPQSLFFLKHLYSTSQCPSPDTQFLIGPPRWPSWPLRGQRTWRGSLSHSPHLAPLYPWTRRGSGTWSPGNSLSGPCPGNQGKIKANYSYCMYLLVNSSNRNPPYLSMIISLGITWRVNIKVIFNLNRRKELAGFEN